MEGYSNEPVLAGGPKTRLPGVGDHRGSGCLICEHGGRSVEGYSNEPVLAGGPKTRLPRIPGGYPTGHHTFSNKTNTVTRLPIIWYRRDIHTETGN